MPFLTQFFDGDVRASLSLIGSVNTAQAPNHDVGYIRDGRIRGEKNKTRHGGQRYVGRNVYYELGQQV